eukprot:687592-Prorocentrum_minimum.AAC.1
MLPVPTLCPPCDPRETPLLRSGRAPAVISCRAPAVVSCRAPAVTRDEALARGPPVEQSEGTRSRLRRNSKFEI